LDPEFEYHVAETQLLGLLGLHIADATVLPIYYIGYAFLLFDYLAEVQVVLEAYNASASVNVASLYGAISHFYSVANAVEEERNSLDTTDLAAVRAFNDRLIQTERAFIYPPGLPGRPFYKHVVQAPGTFAGYDAIPFPGLWEAVIIYNDLNMANQQANIIANQINQAASTLQRPSSPPSQVDQGGLDQVILIVAIVVPVGVVIIIAVVAIIYRRSTKDYTPVT